MCTRKSRHKIHPAPRSEWHTTQAAQNWRFRSLAGMSTKLRAYSTYIYIYIYV